MTYAVSTCLSVPHNHYPPVVNVIMNGYEIPWHIFADKYLENSVFVVNTTLYSSIQKRCDICVAVTIIMFYIIMLIIIML